MRGALAARCFMSVVIIAALTAAVASVVQLANSASTTSTALPTLEAPSWQALHRMLASEAALEHNPAAPQASVSADAETPLMIG
jgi:hypothetical protein